MRLVFDHIHQQFRKEQEMSEQIEPIEPIAGGGAGTDIAGTDQSAPDPRDATIAAQQAEIDRLTGELEQLRGSTTTVEGQVRADDTFDETARREELQRQGASAEDAAEQAAYEARLRADQAAPTPNVTV